MKTYFVYKEDYCQYTDTSRGVIVRTNTPERAKGIAMACMDWSWQGALSIDKSTIKAEEMDIVSEGVVCKTDYPTNSTEWN
ncbi:hypothetical protein [Sporosarcina sp. FSL W7-1283]|uniref:hypothetical protein n=1 Tax=Sporosarcina sp. FSL W7-1283 TaxID=2921560 RepID=UPI0030FD0B94